MLEALEGGEYFCNPQNGDFQLGGYQPCGSWGLFRRLVGRVVGVSEFNPRKVIQTFSRGSEDSLVSQGKWTLTMITPHFLSS